ncbi:hypothetical protein BJX99DRAFT_220258 [Aspergillus californicus]
MACPITVTKFIGTISLGLLTGLSYSTSTIFVPSLSLLSTSTNASKSLKEAQRLHRKHSLRLANTANVCLLFAYSISPRHRKHPYLVWTSIMATVASYGVDYWFHRQDGFMAWIRSVTQDLGCLSMFTKFQKKEDDIVVVEAEENVNGESVQRELENERRLQGVRTMFSGMALSMGIIGLWGDRRP